MCGPAWPLCLLLLGFVLSAVSRTSGVVITPLAPTVEVGQPLNFSCALTTSAGDTIHQVRWLNPHKQTVLAYVPRLPAHISVQDPNVQLQSSHRGISDITIKTVRPEDEGCFHCIFDIYPKGQQEGKACITVTGKVDHKGNKTAIAGKPTTLSCLYTLPEKVHQVLWRKTTERGERTTVGSYSKYGHQSIGDTFLNRVTLNKDMGDSQLTIQEVKMEDEACYTCEFHTYPDGTRSAVVCLSVYVLPKPDVSYVTLPTGVIEANCSAQSKPSAQITWDVGGDNRTLGPPVFSSHNQSDGTTTVTSTVLLRAGALSDVQCIVHHSALDKPLSVPLTNVSPATVVLLVVSSVVAVLLLCLCGCLCKCFVCTDD
uniref:Zgc:172122 n=1 Tax=Neogobius melanostomus TaxID=47308 RepID=A0A8C6UP03_9GOBI